jgi:hypothetical protein
MRKIIFLLLLGGALAAIPGPAVGASSARCGVLYKPNCTAPKLTGQALSVACHKAGNRVAITAQTATSNSGIRKITVVFRGQTIKTYHFSGQGPTRFVVSGVFINTKGLKHGAYTVKITMTDIRGHSVSKTLRFAICLPVPKFTG